MRAMRSRSTRHRPGRCSQLINPSANLVQAKGQAKPPAPPIHMPISFETIVDSGDSSIFDVRSKAAGPQGSLPITAEMLLNRPSGDLFGWAQNAGMGWNPKALGGKEILILSTHGGIRADDGTPIALGFHTGHWEVGLLVKAASEEFARLRCLPFAGAVTDPCDGRTQGTT